MAGKSRERWQVSERESAKAFGTKRIPNNGYGQPDWIATETRQGTAIAAQVKTKAALPAWFLDAMTQAELDVSFLEEEAVPMVVITLSQGPGKGKRQSFCIMKLEDAAKMLT